MNIDAELEALRDKLAQLEDGPAVIGDWHRLEARIGRALVHGSNQLAVLNRMMLDQLRADDVKRFAVQRQLAALRDHMDELRMLRLCAAGRLLELQAEEDQSVAARWARA